MVKRKTVLLTNSRVDCSWIKALQTHVIRLFSEIIINVENITVASLIPYRHINAFCSSHECFQIFSLSSPKKTRSRCLETSPVRFDRRFIIHFTAVAHRNRVRVGRWKKPFSWTVRFMYIRSRRAFRTRNVYTWACMTRSGPTSQYYNYADKNVRQNDNTIIVYICYTNEKIVYGKIKKKKNGWKSLGGK